MVLEKASILDRKIIHRNCGSNWLYTFTIQGSFQLSSLAQTICRDEGHNVQRYEWLRQSWWSLQSRCESWWDPQLIIKPGVDLKMGDSPTFFGHMNIFNREPDSQPVDRQGQASMPGPGEFPRIQGLVQHATAIHSSTQQIITYSLFVPYSFPIHQPGVLNAFLIGVDIIERFNLTLVFWSRQFSPSIIDGHPLPRRADPPVTKSKEISKWFDSLTLGSCHKVGLMVVWRLFKVGSTNKAKLRSIA